MRATRALSGNRSTINRRLFDAATSTEGQEALGWWLACLQAGDSMAHFGLVCTLHELGRCQEAYRHLRHYAEIAPAGAWNWCWLGKAATAIGETEEARSVFEQAIELESAGGEETTAPELLAALHGRSAPRVTSAEDRSASGQLIRGCLLGGAIGDALGAPVEFLSGAELHRQFGEEEVRRYLEADGLGGITDDTQMTLFTAEGLIRARVRAIERGICHEASVLDHAYARWLATQGLEGERWSERALTHGHPSGYLASGFLATTIGCLIEGGEIEEAIVIARRELCEHHRSEQLVEAVDAAIRGARDGGLSSREQVEALGAGWVAEEALAIVLQVALADADPLDALAASVTHGGDSDSTWAIAGNLIGAKLGVTALPAQLLADLAERELVEAVATDVVNLLWGPLPQVAPPIWERCPGW